MGKKTMKELFDEIKIKLMNKYFILKAYEDFSTTLNHIHKLIEVDLRNEDVIVMYFLNVFSPETIYSAYFNRRVVGELLTAIDKGAFLRYLDEKSVEKIIFEISEKSLREKVNYRCNYLKKQLAQVFVQQAELAQIEGNFADFLAADNQLAETNDQEVVSNSE